MIVGSAFFLLHIELFIKVQIGVVYNFILIVESEDQKCDIYWFGYLIIYMGMVVWLFVTLKKDLAFLRQF